MKDVFYHLSKNHFLYGLRRNPDLTDPRTTMYRNIHYPGLWWLLPKKLLIASFDGCFLSTPPLIPYHYLGFKEDADPGSEMIYDGKNSKNKPGRFAALYLALLASAALGGADLCFLYDGGRGGGCLYSGHDRQNC